MHTMHIHTQCTYTRANTTTPSIVSYTNWVEVTDGRITFEDAAGWYGCCYIYQCDGINAMKIYKQVAAALTQP